MGAAALQAATWCTARSAQPCREVVAGNPLTGAAADSECTPFLVPRRGSISAPAPATLMLFVGRDPRNARGTRQTKLLTACACAVLACARARARACVCARARVGACVCARAAAPARACVGACGRVCPWVGAVIVSGRARDRQAGTREDGELATSQRVMTPERGSERTRGYGCRNWQVPHSKAFVVTSKDAERPRNSLPAFLFMGGRVAVVSFFAPTLSRDTAVRARIGHFALLR